jgi:hypothetical protein
MPFRLMLRMSTHIAVTPPKDGVVWGERAGAVADTPIETPI